MDGEHEDERGEQARGVRPVRAGQAIGEIPPREGGDRRDPDLRGGDECQRAEHEFDVGHGAQRVGHQPDEAERRHQPQPRHERIRARGSQHEEWIEGEPERGQPQREPASPDEIAARPALRSQHQRPDRQGDIEEVGHPEIDRAGRERVVAEAEDRRRDQPDQAPFRPLHHEEAKGDRRGRGQEPHPGDAFGSWSTATPIPTADAQTRSATAARRTLAVSVNRGAREDGASAGSVVAVRPRGESADFGRFRMLRGPCLRDA